MNWWLPPYLIPLQKTPPVALQPEHPASWLFWLIMGPAAVGWLGSYALAIHRAHIDKRVGIPAFMVAVDFAWEFSLAFILQQDSQQRHIDLAWVLFDSVVLYQVFKYGRKDYPSLSKRQFNGIIVGILLYCSVLVMVGVNEIHDQNGIYTGSIINIPLSVAFIVMLRRRKSSVGQSMYIALSKAIGTVFAETGALLVYPTHWLLLVLFPTMSAIDIVYIVLLRRTIIAEGQSPWAFRRPPVQLPAEGDVSNPSAESRTIISETAKERA